MKQGGKNAAGEAAQKRRKKIEVTCACCGVVPTGQVLDGVGRQIPLAVFEHGDLAMVVTIDGDFFFVHSAEIILGAEWIFETLRQSLCEGFGSATGPLLAGNMVCLKRQLAF